MNLFGRLTANLLKPKDVLGFIGDLGAGKTYLAGQIAHALGVPESISVTSPTFTLIKEYHQGRIPIYHMDLYRLSSPDDLYELGLWEYYDGNGVCIVEWSNMFEDLWPEHALVVKISFQQGESRLITLSGQDRGLELAENLKTAWTNSKSKTKNAEN